MTPTWRVTYPSGVTLALRAQTKADAYLFGQNSGKVHNVDQPAYVERLYGPAAARAELGVFQYGA